jgi:hypothetical protein
MHFHSNDEMFIFNYRCEDWSILKNKVQSTNIYREMDKFKLSVENPTNSAINFD